MTEQKKRKTPVPKSVNPNKTDDGTFKFYDDASGNTYEVRADGVYRKDSKPNSMFIKLCAALELVAHTRNNDGDDWGVWIRFKDADAQPHELILSRKLFSQGKKVEELLSSAGLHVPILSGNSGRCPLAEFFNAVPWSLPRALSVSRGGFVSNKFNTFVFGNEVLRLEGAEQVKLSDPKLAAPLTENGTLEEWQEKIAVPALHSVRLVFFLCVSLASPLLEIVGVPTSIFHIFGKRGKGKTTAMYVAISVWGGKERFFTWSSTDNGLEALATQFNNQLVCLDEIGQATEKAINTFYGFANGTAKVRMGRNTQMREVQRWSTNAVSSGEQSATEIHKRKAKSSNEGLASGNLVRILGIPAMSDSGLGILDSLPSIEDGSIDPNDKITRAKAVVDSIQECVKEGVATGCAGRKYLMDLMHEVNSRIDGVERLKQRLKMMIATFREALKDEAPLTDSEVRVLDRFAVAALAGELATGFGVMGDKWKAGTATNAAIECFKIWRTSEDSPEERTRQVVEKVLELPDVERSTYLQFEIHNDGSFSLLNQFSRPSAGTVFLKNGNRISSRIATFYRTQQFDEVCTNYCEGLNKDEVLEALETAGLLHQNIEGRKQYQFRKDFCEWKKGQWALILVPENSEQCHREAERMIKGARNV